MMLDHNGEVVTLLNRLAPSSSNFPSLPNASPLARARMPVTHDVSLRGFDTTKIPFFGHFCRILPLPDLSRDLQTSHLCHHVCVSGTRLLNIPE